MREISHWNFSKSSIGPCTLASKISIPNRNIQEMNYFNGQAPTTSTNLPFTFHPMQRAAATYGKAVAQPSFMPSVGFPSSHSQQTSSVGIKPAAEVYSSSAWNLKPGANVGGSSFDNFGASVNSKGQEGSEPPHHGQNGRYAYGGKGREKGDGRWGRKGFQERENPGMPVGKQANAIPLGKQRVFASSPEASEAVETERRRPRSPEHRPMQVVGRGRALTVPAWAKEASKAPGEDRYAREDDRSYRRDDRPPPPRYDDRRSERQPRPDSERIRPRMDERAPRNFERGPSRYYSEESPRSRRRVSRSRSPPRRRSRKGRK